MTLGQLRIYARQIGAPVIDRPPEMRTRQEEAVAKAERAAALAQRNAEHRAMLAEAGQR